MSAFGPTSKVLCAGWLKKSSIKGHKQTPWKERYCVLSTDGVGLERRCTLHYYAKAWKVRRQELLRWGCWLGWYAREWRMFNFYSYLVYLMLSS